MSIDLKETISKLPDEPGVYLFKDNSGKILYIGKATSLRDRVRSYFVSDIQFVRSPLIAKMVLEAEDIAFQKTDSVLEALILEASLIKKHQPLYNTKEKDNKSFNYVVITKEDFPRILMIRGRDLDSKLKAKIQGAVIFDPPSNIRTSPNGEILCSIKNTKSISIYGSIGSWDYTDVCGDMGVIHSSQIRF